jgi:tetratricopeptide (TPR) repeat protein
VAASAPTWTRILARAVVAITSPLGAWLPPSWVRARVRALVDAGEADAALLLGHQALAHGQARDPEDAAWIAFHTGRAAHAKGLADQARSRFARAAAWLPGEPTFAFALGWSLRDERRFDPAREALEAAERLAPTDPRIPYLLGLTLRDLERTDEARAPFERVLALNPKDVRARYALGLCLYEGKRLDEALPHFETVTRLDAKHMRGHYQTGAVHLALGRLSQAEAPLRRALALRADFGPTHYALGRVLAPRDETAARRHLLEALTLRPAVVVAWLELGRLHERAGRLGPAIQAYDEYLRAHPNAPGHEGLRRHLFELRAARAASTSAP